MPNVNVIWVIPGGDFVPLPTHRLHVAPHVHINNEKSLPWLYRLQKICKNHLGKCLVKNLHISECVDVELEGFELKADPIWHILNFHASKIRVVGKRADAGEFWSRDGDPVLARRKPIKLKSNQGGLFAKLLAKLLDVNLGVICSLLVELIDRHKELYNTVKYSNNSALWKECFSHHPELVV